MDIFLNHIPYILYTAGQATQTARESDTTYNLINVARDALNIHGRFTESSYQVHDSHSGFGYYIDEDTHWNLWWTPKITKSGGY